jgi:hypothetical protein
MTKQELEQLKTEDRIFNAFATGVVVGVAIMTIMGVMFL